MNGKQRHITEPTKAAWPDAVAELRGNVCTGTHAPPTKVTLGHHVPTRLAGKRGRVKGGSVDS